METARPSLTQQQQQQYPYPYSEGLQGPTNSLPLPTPYRDGASTTFPPVAHADAAPATSGSNSPRGAAAQGQRGAGSPGSRPASARLTMAPVAPGPLVPGGSAQVLPAPLDLAKQQPLRRDSGDVSGGGGLAARTSPTSRPGSRPNSAGRRGGGGDAPLGQELTPTGASGASRFAPPADGSGKARPGSAGSQRASGGRPLGEGREDEHLPPLAAADGAALRYQPLPAGSPAQGSPAASTPTSTAGAGPFKEGGELPPLGQSRLGAAVAGGAYQPLPSAGPSEGGAGGGGYKPQPGLSEEGAVAAQGLLPVRACVVAVGQGACRGHLAVCEMKHDRCACVPALAGGSAGRRAVARRPAQLPGGVWRVGGQPGAAGRARALAGRPARAALAAAR